MDAIEKLKSFSVTKADAEKDIALIDRKSTRLNSSHHLTSRMPYH